MDFHMDEDTKSLVEGLIDQVELGKQDRKVRARRGRPNAIEEGRLTIFELRADYVKSRSVRKTAENFSISPTTVKKYLKGNLKPVGRNLQGKAWNVKMRTPVHQWFVEHKDEKLPESPQRLAEMSGFTSRAISQYILKRRKAVVAYLRSLPEPNEHFVIYTDTLGRKLPSNLIKAYIIDVDPYSLDVRLSVLLTIGGQRTIITTLQAYLEYITGRSGVI